MHRRHAILPLRLEERKERLVPSHGFEPRQETVGGLCQGEE